LLAVALLAGSACTVGPGYKRPTAQVPDTWKGEGPWQAAAPKDAIPKGAWWQLFHDAELDRLEQELLQANQSLEAARDRLSQARSQARIASSAYFPTLSANPSGQRQELSSNRSFSSGELPPFTQNDFVVPFSVSYELDLFGRVRRNLEAANASLQGSAADLENVRLVLTAELAADYFNLRELDREAGVVRQSVEIQQKGLDLVNHRHEGGVANGLEVAQQAALLDATATQLSLVLQQRAQYEHAIAALTGKSASAFSLVEAPFNAAPPAIPTGVPSEILERRPDVATSERQMAFENAQVGLATAAFYPHITLAGSGGYESRDIATLLNAPSAMCRWAVICCSRFLMADAIAPPWRPAALPMTNRWPIIANRCWWHFSRWRMGSPASRCLIRRRRLNWRRSPTRAAPSTSPTTVMSAASPPTSM